MAKKPKMTIQVLRVLKAFMADPLVELAGIDLLNQTKLASGTVYPILIRLEKAGWLESHWEDVEPKEIGRPRKRLYRLTSLGCNRAEAELNARQGVLNDVWIGIFNLSRLMHCSSS